MLGKIPEQWYTVEVEFASNHLARCAVDERLAAREWGARIARRYQERVNALLDAPDFNFLRSSQAFRLHSLEGQRREQYTIYLTGRWRLIITRGPGANTVTVEEVSNHYGN